MTDEEFEKLGKDAMKLVPLFSKAIGEAADKEGVMTSPAAVVLSLGLMMRSTAGTMAELEESQDFCQEMLKVAFSNFG
tara:strand:+ start:20 stop:253 length:234 start_codon:yes stop_codon:yes gene_type:complete